MNIYESILISFVLIYFPITFYLLSELMSKTFDSKKQDLYFEVALISSSYLLIRYGVMMFNKIPFILLYIPLFIAYSSKKDKLIIILTLMDIYYYHTYFGIPIYLLLIEFIIYYLLYSFLYLKKNNLMLDIMLKIRLIFLMIWVFLEPKLFINDDYRMIHIIWLMILLVLSYKFIMYLFYKTEGVIHMHKMITKVEDQKEMYQSLFKITHEIKNPIAVCKGYLDMFDISNIEHSRKYIPIIKSEIDRLLILLEDFLSINRIKIEKEILDIDLLIEDVVYNFKPILQDKKIVISYTSKDELFIEGDYNRLKQVFVNLIKNSIESIEMSGRIDIDYSVKKDFIYIHIEDNGIGMTREEIAKLNEPFYTTKNKGTGLGVYLSREIIKLHGGSILFKSKKYYGTKTTIKLPKGNIKYFD